MHEPERVPSPPDRQHARLIRAQEDLNQASAGQWDGYATHRRAVTDLLLGEAPDPLGRLVVLGAGNCNDLDLVRIVRAFEQIHLVDVDEAALRAAVGRQDVQAAQTIRLHGAVDVTRLGWQQDRRVEPAQVVVSATLLTQLINTAVQAGHGPQELLSVRDAHLQAMTDLLRADGRGLLINDVVSTDTCPQLRKTPHEALPALLSRLLHDGNFFTGCNPFAITRRLSTDPRFRAANIGMSAPWRWDMGTRSHLVYAIRFRRRPDPNSSADSSPEPD